MKVIFAVPYSLSGFTVFFPIFERSSMLRRVFLAAVLVLLTAGYGWCANILFYGETDKNPLEYQPGEQMVFSIQLLEDGKPLTGKTLKWERRGDDGEKTRGEAVSADQPLVIKTSISQPGFVHIIVDAFDADGKRTMNGEKPVVTFDGGAGVFLDKLQGYPEPEDFDAYWAKQKARLAEVPMKAQMVPVEISNKNVLSFDVKIDCIGMPVSGYFCKPKDAKEKSLPARVSFHGYGVSGSNTPIWASNCLALDINAHGIENGKPQEFYDNLRKTTLNGYGLRKADNQTPEQAYFNGMFLRMIRALEWIKSQPEWDGKTLIVSGGSQGGLQCLSAAGLDPQVTECNAFVPWCCNIAVAQQGRQPSVFWPDYTDAMRYFDAANHAKRIKGKVSIVSGLGDYVCPPSTQAVLYNNIKAPKKHQYLQGKTHGYNMPNGKSYIISENWAE